MRLASYRDPRGEGSYGLVRDDEIVDLRNRLKIPDLKALLRIGLESAHAYMKATADFALNDIELLPPIPSPDHIFGIGFNTRSHAKEAVRPAVN